MEFIFPNFFSRLQPYLFLPRPYYYFSSVFCPEMFQNLLFFWKKQTFLFSQGRVEIFLSRGTTWVGPGDNKDSYPPEGQQFPTWGTKNISTLPRENNKKFVSSRKKEDFETFLGRKHWKNSNMAEAGKDKAATLKKNLE